MSDMKEKWQTADAPIKLMIVGGIIMGALIIVMFINMMLPKKQHVQQYIPKQEGVPQEIYTRLEALEASLEKLSKHTGEVVTTIRDEQKKSDALYRETFHTLAEEVENHRMVIESLGRLQAVPKSIRVIHENKGETMSRGQTTE